MATKTLFLIRHGQYYFHNEHIDKMGGSLTPAGIQQAQATAQRVKALPITAIHSSSMPRALETARVIAAELPNVPFQYADDLWECLPHIPPKFAKYFTNYTPEAIAADRAHAENAFNKYFQPTTETLNQTELIIAHGTLIRYLVCRVLEIEPEAWANLDMCNCGISEVMIEANGNMTLISHNDVGHLPPQLITSTLAGRLAPAMYQLAQLAYNRDDMFEARWQAEDSFFLLKKIGSEAAAEQVKAWLDQLPEIDDADVFGGKLQTLREARGMTLAELAEAFELKHTRYLANVEAGKRKPSANLIINVAHYFDVSIESLLAAPPDDPPPEKSDTKDLND
jgi:serine/threonine-protein phosphatase PGAM5